MNDKKSVSWLIKSSGKQKSYIVILLFLHMIVNGIVVSYAFIMKRMIDGAIEKNKDVFFSTLFLFAFLMFSLIVIRILLRQLEETSRISIENSLKEKLFSKLLHKDFGQVSSIHSEEWMNRITSDTVVCANGMTEILPEFMGLTVRMIGAFTMIFILHSKISYVLIPGGIGFLCITLLLRKYLKASHKRVQEKDGALRVYLQERISSMLVIRTFGVEKQAIANAKNKFSQYRKVRLKKAFLSNLCNTGFSSAINSMYLIGIGYCGYGILNGIMSCGTLTAIIQLIGQLQAPLSGISGFVPRFYNMLASAERLMEIEDYNDVHIPNIKTAEATRVLYDRSIEKIVFDNVSFNYEKENDKRSVLNNISCSIHKGDYVAITGISGCGKSTLLKILMGIYKPSSGSVNVVFNDNKKIPVGDLRRLFAYVPQGNHLMNGTIRDVVTFGESRNSSTITLESVLRLACGDFVFELTNGIDTVLGEKGSGLSEGQMQRIAIARALYTDSPILILDEATSALDPETEQKLLCNLKQLTDKTVLIVTHRKDVLTICNKKLEFRENFTLKDG